MRLPDEAMASGSGCWRRASPAGRRPRDAKRALARAIIARFHDERRGRRPPSSASTACIVEHGIPDEIADVDVGPADGAVHLPGGARDRRSASRARRPGG